MKQGSKRQHCRSVGKHCTAREKRAKGKRKPHVRPCDPAYKPSAHSLCGSGTCLCDVNPFRVLCTGTFQARGARQEVEHLPKPLAAFETSMGASKLSSPSLHSFSTAPRPHYVVELAETMCMFVPCCWYVYWRRRSSVRGLEAHRRQQWQSFPSWPIITSTSTPHFTNHHPLHPNTATDR